MKKTVKISAFFALVSTCVLAQEKDSLSINPLKEVVISDTKFTLKKEKSGKVIEVITADDLAKKSGQSLATVLSQVAGVEINGNQSSNCVMMPSCFYKNTVGAEIFVSCET